MIWNIIASFLWLCLGLILGTDIAPHLKHAPASLAPIDNTMIDVIALPVIVSYQKSPGDANATIYYYAFSLPHGETLYCEHPGPIKKTFTVPVEVRAFQPKPITQGDTKTYVSEHCFVDINAASSDYVAPSTAAP